jgi:hypothetical protein
VICGVSRKEHCGDAQFLGIVEIPLPILWRYRHFNFITIISLNLGELKHEK